MDPDRIMGNGIWKVKEVEGVMYRVEGAEGDAG